MPSGTTRFIRNYATENATALVGTLPGFVPGYPPGNLLVRDRNVKWIYDLSASDATVGIDIGVGKTVDVLGLAGALRGGGFPVNIAWQAAFTFPNPVVSGCTTSNLNALITRTVGSFVTDKVKVGQQISGTQIAAGATVQAVTPTTVTMSVNGTAVATGTAVVTFTDRVDVISTAMDTDRYTVLAAPVTFRYYFPNVQFANFAKWGVGKYVIGRLTDLGIAYSPGSAEATLLQRVHNRAVSGALLTTSTGPNRKRITYLFRSVPTSVRDVLVSAVAGAPFLMLTPFGESLELDVPEDGLTVANTWGAPDLFDITLSAESLP